MRSTASVLSVQYWKTAVKARSYMKNADFDEMRNGDTLGDLQMRVDVADCTLAKIVVDIREVAVVADIRRRSCSTSGLSVAQVDPVDAERNRRVVRRDDVQRIVLVHDGDGSTAKTFCVQSTRTTGRCAQKKTPTAHLFGGAGPNGASSSGTK